MKKALLVAAATALLLPLTASAERTGDEVYNSKCAVCHAAGVAGAPKTGTADWDSRMAKGIDGLVASSKTGLNAMPPKGTCMDCTDGELKAAIEKMVQK